MYSLTSSSTSTLITTNPLSPQHKPFLNLPKHTLINIKPKQNPTIFLTHAQNSNDTNTKQVNGNDEVKDNNNGRPRFNLSWKDLVLDPDPDNIVAVGLTGVLAWAGVQVLWQLFFISFAILVAALKYSFIAALLVFILITLL